LFVAVAMAGRGFVVVMAVLVLGCVGFAAATPVEDAIRQVTDRAEAVGDGTVGQLAHALCGAENKFEGFMKEFGKVYHTVEEYEHRFGVFKDNLLKALKHQALDPTASHGVTQFSDLTEEEFGHQYLGLKAPSVLKTEPSAPILPTGDLPPSFDWREKGAVSVVKNQVIDLPFFSFGFIFPGG
jgi:cathepsin F